MWKNHLNWFKKIYHWQLPIFDVNPGHKFVEYLWFLSIHCELTCAKHNAIVSSKNVNRVDSPDCLCHDTENLRSPWCQLCHHWWNHRLSQPVVPPVMAKLVSWQLWVISVHDSALIWQHIEGNVVGLLWICLQHETSNGKDILLWYYLLIVFHYFALFQFILQNCLQGHYYNMMF